MYLNKVTTRVMHKRYLVPIRLLNGKDMCIACKKRSNNGMFHAKHHYQLHARTKNGFKITNA